MEAHAPDGGDIFSSPAVGAVAAGGLLPASQHRLSPVEVEALGVVVVVAVAVPSAQPWPLGLLISAQEPDLS